MWVSRAGVGLRGRVFSWTGQLRLIVCRWRRASDALQPQAIYADRVRRLQNFKSIAWAADWSGQNAPVLACCAGHPRAFHAGEPSSPQGSLFAHTLPSVNIAFPLWHDETNARAPNQTEREMGLDYQIYSLPGGHQAYHALKREYEIRYGKNAGKRMAQNEANRRFREGTLVPNQPRPAAGGNPAAGGAGAAGQGANQPAYRQAGPSAAEQEARRREAQLLEQQRAEADDANAAQNEDESGVRVCSRSGASAGKCFKRFVTPWPRPRELTTLFVLTCFETGPGNHLQPLQVRPSQGERLHCRSLSELCPRSLTSTQHKCRNRLRLQLPRSGEAEGLTHTTRGAAAASHASSALARGPLRACRSRFHKFLPLPLHAYIHTNIAAA